MFTFFFAKKKPTPITALVVKDNAITVYVKTYEADLITTIDGSKMKACLQKYQHKNQEFVKQQPSPIDHKKVHSHTPPQEYEDEGTFGHHHIYYKKPVTPEQFNSFLESLQTCNSAITDTEKKDVQASFESYFKKPKKNYRHSNSKGYKYYGMPSLPEHAHCIERGLSECPPPAIVGATMMLGAVMVGALMIYSMFTCCKRKNNISATETDAVPRSGHRRDEIFKLHH